MSKSSVPRPQSKDSSSVHEKAPSEAAGSKARDQHVLPAEDVHHGLHRALSSRQVQMIAIAGTIGTGLFLGVYPLL